MKKHQSLMAVPLFALASQAALAGSITCGTHTIEDGQITGQSRSEVEKKCGPPEKSVGDELYYKKDNVTYRLHFNDSNELESIIEQVE